MGRLRLWALGERSRHRIDRPAGPPNPFEFYLLLYAAAAGTATVLGLASPRTIDVAVSPGFRYVWACLLTAGCYLSLAGMYWPGDRYTGLFVKRSGLLAVAGAELGYGIALAALGKPGVVVALLNLGFGTAAVARVWQITKAVAKDRQRNRKAADKGPP
jgi:hypothetical protein